MRTAAGAFVLTLLAGPAFAADETAAMHDAAARFYAVYATFHPSDGIPNGQDRARYEPVISPALDALLKQADEAEQRFSRENRGSPPLIEGDLFTSLFEGATKAEVGTCSGDAARGKCSVNLTYSDPSPKGKPQSWSDTVLLVNTPQGWRVDDIVYGGGWAFGNKGKLTDTLRQTISFQ